MFWMFVLVAVLAVVFIKLGMYSVWITVLSTALHLAVVIIAGLTIALIWRQFFRKRGSQ